jgi:hypothetical protein
MHMPSHMRLAPALMLTLAVANQTAAQPLPDSTRVAIKALVSAASRRGDIHSADDAALKR